MMEECRHIPHMTGHISDVYEAGHVGSSFQGVDNTNGLVRLIPKRNKQQNVDIA